MVYIYDIEVLKNLFTVTFVNALSKETLQFVIHPSRDDRPQLLPFLDSDIKLVGYNCINFDWPVTREIMKYRTLSTSKILKKITNKANERVNSPKGYYGPMEIPHRDLMKIHHFDNKARITSLKWLQFNMGFETIQDMPLSHHDEVDASQIPMVLEYNLNDVMATLELYNRSKGMIRMRNKISQDFGIDMNNYPNSKIGETIVLKLLSDKMEVSIDALKACRTPRPEVRVKDCVDGKISFETTEFNSILDTFKEKVYIPGNKSKEELMVKFDGLEYYFGWGGIHAARPPGIFANIHSADVTGYYPSYMISQKFSPAHFGDPFCEVYGALPGLRAQYPKGTPLNAAYKEAQVSVFGKSNSEYSPFYDPMLFLKTTINGQLSLCMLCERLTLSGSAKVFMVNTDGIEVEMIDSERFFKECKEWEKLFGLTLEHSTYSKIAMRDVNNYLAITDTGKIKEKGCFLTEVDLHKDSSMRVVPYAAQEFIIKGISVEETINNTIDISKFMMGVRAKTGHFVDQDGTTLPKTIRYYVSTDGITLLKRLSKGDVNVHVGKKVTICNNWPSNFDNLDKNFYISETYKLLDALKPKAPKPEQLKLF